MKLDKPYTLTGLMLLAMLSVAGCATMGKSVSAQATNTSETSTTAKNATNSTFPPETVNSTNTKIAGDQSAKNTTPSPVTVKLPSTVHKFNFKVQYLDKVSSSEQLFPEKIDIAVQQWNFPNPRNPITGVSKLGTYRPQQLPRNKVVFSGLSSPTTENSRVAWNTPIGHVMIIPMPNNEYEMVFIGLLQIEKMQIQNLTTHKSAKMVPYKKGENPSFATWIVKSNTWYSLTEQGIGSPKTIVFPNFEISTK